jgi:SAM-dependent MidA family methyltransferase
MIFVTSPTASARTPSSSLTDLIEGEIRAADGWLPFDRFMHLALYAPGLGYYARGSARFGSLARDGSDFVTAPELSPLFGRALAAQVAQSLAATGTSGVWEFGAGSGALAGQLIDALGALGQPLAHYTIIDVSGALRARQQTRLARFGAHVRWADRLPDALSGVVIGNEVLDAMPVKLLARTGGMWYERGVAVSECVQVPAPIGQSPETTSHSLPKGVPRQEPKESKNYGAGHAKAPVTGVSPAMRCTPLRGEAQHRPASGAWKCPKFVWKDRPTALRPPVEISGIHDYVTEVHEQARAFVTTVADKLRVGGAGAAYFIDYGFPEAEYWHPERSHGTLACHRAHRVDDDPLADVGDKDITAHVDFTNVALAAQNAGLDVLGYASQGRFLINCGIAPMMETASLPERAAALKLLAEHEMGELFKVIALATPGHGLALGFATGDRTHRL